MTRSITYFSSLLFVGFLAACSADSPMATEQVVENAQIAVKPGSCTFVTPNGKTHTSSANAKACPKAGPIDVQHIAGTYHLTSLIVIQDGVPSSDADVEGEYINLTLNPDGTTSGHFFVPANPGEEGSGMDVGLTGTYTLNGNVVTLDFVDEALIECNAGGSFLY